MKANTSIRYASPIALALVLAVLTGCGASSNYEKGASAGAGLNEAASKISSDQGRLDAVVTSLNELVASSQGDLVPKFKKFDSEVTALETAAKHVNEVVTKMRETGNEYFKTWDEQTAMIKNEDIKSRSAARRAEMEKKFMAIKQSYITTEDGFKPFLSDVKDIQTALRTDLTPGGVAAIKPAAEKANKDAAPLKASVAELVGHFKDLGAAMSASAPAAAAAAAAAQAGGAAGTTK